MLVTVNYSFFANVRILGRIENREKSEIVALIAECRLLCADGFYEHSPGQPCINVHTVQNGKFLYTVGRHIQSLHHLFKSPILWYRFDDDSLWFTINFGGIRQCPEPISNRFEGIELIIKVGLITHPM